MTRLDAEERAAREPVESRRLTPPEIVDYTRSLPRLCADSGANGKQALVGAVFAKLDVSASSTSSRRMRSTSDWTPRCRG